MEQEYWERFFHSGSVNDYLEYKAMDICSRTISKYGGESNAGRAEDYHTDRTGGIDDIEKIINDAGGIWRCREQMAEYRDSRDI